MGAEFQFCKIKESWGFAANNPNVLTTTHLDILK